MKDPAAIYGSLKAEHQEELERLLKKRNRFGWLRFIVFFITIAVSYQVFVNWDLWGIVPAITGVGILLFLVSRDVNNNRAIQNSRALIRINEEELQYLEHQFTDHYDGSTFIPRQHHYANDLDLFGSSGIYQWMNRCYSEHGRSLLAHDLLHPQTKDVVLIRQEAVKEMAGMVKWRQQLQAIATHTTITSGTQRKANQWMSEDEKYFRNNNWKIFVWLWSVVTVLVTVAAIAGFIPGGFYSFLYGLFLATSVVLSRNTIKPYILLSGIVKEITTLHQLVNWIEQQPFNSGRMNDLLHSVSDDDSKAADEILSLKSILDKFDLRLNLAGLLFFNVFFLWDIRQMMALNAWRRKNKNYLNSWFTLIGETELLHSLAVVKFNNPGFTWPEIADEHFTFQAQALGHPLIPGSSRVDNDFEINGQGKIGLITGSNMAGKSTFLRSLGVNLVMAQMGAPVCASAFRFSPVKLMSSMRIADNLAENTSTFYAELKKLKTIIEAVNRGEKVFILLDEILRGTNSFDRHTGSKALIRQLIRQKAVSVIATHDVELAALSDQYPGTLINYHFDVQVDGGELYFDYKLKHDVCTSLNASILMKKIGIEMEE